MTDNYLTTQNGCPKCKRLGCECKDKTEAREVSVEPTRWVIAHPETDFGSIEVVASLAYDLLEKRVKELELDERMASREVERQLKINNELRERVQKLEAALERSKEWLYTIETGIVRTNTYKAAGYDARQTARLAWFDIDQILKGEGEL